MSDQKRKPRPGPGRPKGSTVNPEALKKAEELWLDGYSYAEISARSGLEEQTIKYHAKYKKDAWRKKIFTDPFFAKALQSDAKEVRETRGVLLSLIRREAVRRLKQQDEPLTVVETKLVSDMAANLDRMCRLDEKMPTDILERRDMSPKEVRDEICRILSGMKDKDPLGEFDEESLREESGDSKIVQ